MFPLTAFGLFITFLYNISGFPTEIKISLIWFIHLNLLPCCDSISIMLYIILESFVSLLFNTGIQKPIIRDLY